MTVILIYEKCFFIYVCWLCKNWILYILKAEAIFENLSFNKEIVWFSREKHFLLKWQSWEDEIRKRPLQKILHNSQIWFKSLSFSLGLVNNCYCHLTWQSFPVLLDEWTLVCNSFFDNCKKRRLEASKVTTLQVWCETRRRIETKCFLLLWNSSHIFWTSLSLETLSQHCWVRRKEDSIATESFYQSYQFLSGLWLGICF